MSFEALPHGITRVAACRLRRSPRHWAWAEASRAEIEVAWADSVRSRPYLYNGVVQIMLGARIARDTLEADYAETDFASFHRWRSLDARDMSVRDGFGSALILSAEGHLLLGRQAAGNMNAGFAYAPGGFIDASDVRPDGAIDIEGSIAREVGEETGLDAAGGCPAGLVREPGFLVTHVGFKVSIGVIYRSALATAALVALMRQYLAAEASPELEDIVAIRTAADAAATAMPDFARVQVAAIVGG